MFGWTQGLVALAETTSVSSQTQAPLDLVMGDALAGVEFGDSCLDLRKKDQTLDGVLECRVWWKLLDGFANLIPSAYGHEEIVAPISVSNG